MDLNTFTATIEDDNEAKFEITIDYAFATGFFKTTVAWFNYKINGNPQLPADILESQIKNLIKIEENTTVEFI